MAVAEGLTAECLAADRATLMAKPPRRCQVASVGRVVDGDTLIVLLDLGFETFRQVIVRLARIDAPELNTLDGVSARAYLVGVVTGDSKHLDVESYGKDRYGRYICELIVRDTGENVGTTMVEKGLAKPWNAR